LAKINATIIKKHGMVAAYKTGSDPMFLYR
jgi:hypothetical protein